MQRVVRTLGRGVGGGGGHRFGVRLGVLGCFVDVNESLAGCSIGSVGSLAIGTLEYCMGAGLPRCLASGAGVEACVVFTSIELASNLLPGDCEVVSKPLAGIALAVGLGIAVCSTPYLYCSNKLAFLDDSICLLLFLETK